MKRRILQFLPWFIGLALLAWIVRSISFESVIEVLQRLQSWQIVALVVINLVILLTISGRWWVLLLGQGYRLPFRRVFGYRLAVFGLSYFTPGPQVGGEPLQVLLVEKNHDVPRNAALAAVALDKTIEFSVNFALLFLAVAAILQWRIVPAESGRQALGLIGAILLVPVGYLGATAAGYHPLSRIFRPVAGWRPLRRWQPRLKSALATLESGEQMMADFYRRAPKIFALAIAVSFVSWIVLIGEFWLMVSFLGVNLTVPQLVTALAAARISILLLLPAGLGALELSQTLSFGLLGLDPAIGLSLSLLIRTRDSLVGGLGLWWGSRQISSWGQRPAQREKPGITN